MTRIQPNWCEATLSLFLSGSLSRYDVLVEVLGAEMYQTAEIIEKNFPDGPKTTPVRSGRYASQQG